MGGGGGAVTGFQGGNFGVPGLHDPPEPQADGIRVGKRPAAFIVESLAVFQAIAVIFL